MQFYDFNMVSPDLKKNCFACNLSNMIWYKDAAYVSNPLSDPGTMKFAYILGQSVCPRLEDNNASKFQFSIHKIYVTHHCPS